MGVELRRWVEVVREEFLGGIFCFPTGVRDVEFGLGWPPGGMDQRGRGGLADVGGGATRLTGRQAPD